MKTLKKWLFVTVVCIVVVACGKKKQEAETTANKTVAKETAVVAKQTPKKVAIKKLSKKEMRQIKREKKRLEREARRKKRELEKNKK